MGYFVFIKDCTFDNFTASGPKADILCKQTVHYFYNFSCIRWTTFIYRLPIETKVNNMQRRVTHHKTDKIMLLLSTKETKLKAERKIIISWKKMRFKHINNRQVVICNESTARDYLHLTFRWWIKRHLFLDWKVTNGFIKLKCQKKFLRCLLNIFN